MSTPRLTTMAPQYSVLTDHVCLEARGRDAGAFLHGQLSQAVEALDSTGAPLAAWHDARGQVRALFRVWRLPERWLLVTPRDGAEPLRNRLRLFVVRSAVTLEIAGDVAVAAVLDADDTWLTRQDLPTDTRPNSVVLRDDLRWVRVGETYWQALGTTAALAPLAASLEPAERDAAALAEIRLGIPAVTSHLTERFVAQMLNLDELGAVSFDKGCYPGQEIIARIHNLGGVKRRLRRYSAAAAPAPVGTVVAAAESGAAVGEVVRSAATAAGSELLAVVENAAADTALVQSGGAPLRALALPFFVPRD